MLRLLTVVICADAAGQVEAHSMTRKFPEDFGFLATYPTFSVPTDAWLASASSWPFTSLSPPVTVFLFKKVFHLARAVLKTGCGRRAPQLGALTRRCV